MKTMIDKTDKKDGSKGVITKKRNRDLFKKNQSKIIKKATKLFMKKGYAQSSMREISKVTGIDISNLYYFIKSKEEILFLAFDMLHSPASDLFEKHDIFGIEEPEEQLKKAIRELIKINYDYKDEILLLYRESMILPKKFLKIVLERESRLVHHFEEILTKLAEREGFNIPNPAFTANMIVYQMSLYPLRNWNLGKYTKEALMDLTERHIMNAIRNSSAPT